MSGQVRVYLIFYGNFPDIAVNALADMVRYIGSTSYWNIQSQYCDSTGACVGSNIVLGCVVYDKYSGGQSLSGYENIFPIVTRQIASGALPLDPNGIYSIITDSTVSVTTYSGGNPQTFCGSYCGWHSYASYQGMYLKYLFAGDATVKCPDVCLAYPYATAANGSPLYPAPNGHVGADGIATILAHEIVETVTDPKLDAWYVSQQASVSSERFIGDENADICIWNFGPASWTYTAKNGSPANVKIGARDFYLQTQWKNSGGAPVNDATHCVLSL
jgi:hypothetical protein